MQKDEVRVCKREIKDGEMNNKIFSNSKKVFLSSSHLDSVTLSSQIPKNKF